MYVNGNYVIYFDSFGVQHIPKKSWETKVSIKIPTDIIQAYDWIMHRYFCIGLLILC